MVTYDEILSSMLGKYSQLSGFEPSKASDIYIRLCVLAGELYNTSVNIEWLKRQTFAGTATGEYLDLHAEERGITRRSASSAVGNVKFTSELGALVDIVIPRGTVVSTAGGAPLCFETTADVTMKQGTYAVNAPIRAIAKGSKYNVAPGKITVIVTSVQGNLKVTNPETCRSGTDAESDESLRVRVVDSYKNASNGTNCAYYEKVAMQIPGITAARAVPRGRGAGTVDVYVASSDSSVADETLKKVQDTLAKLREVNVDVLAKKASPAVVNLNLRIDLCDGYEFDQVRKACENALREYINSRGVGGNVLLTEAGERIYHVEGVREYTFDSYENSDIRCENSHYPVMGSVNVTQGVLV
ncbi:MAG: baseplate J/gp47 family protein [Ruminococcus sp.]|nr:baseplate J/gp47 family protein [Ruminococcus sp.]